MRWLLGCVLTLLAVVTVGIAILVMLIPDTAIERHFLASVARATGTSVTTSGPPDVRLFQSISLTLRGVTVRPAHRQSPQLTAAKVHADIAWLPILTRWTIAVAELKLEDPRLELTEPANAPAAAIEPNGAGRSRHRTYLPPSVRIEHISLEGGTIAGLPPDLRVTGIRASIPLDDASPGNPAELAMFVNGDRLAGTVDNSRLRDTDWRETGSIERAVRQIVGTLRSTR